MVSLILFIIYVLDFFLLLPDSKFKIFWSYILIFRLLYTAFITPIRITFIDKIDLTWFIIDLIIDILFFIDIIITFNTAYYNSYGELITNRKVIALSYLKTYFILDLLTIIPFTYIFEDSSKY